MRPATHTVRPLSMPYDLRECPVPEITHFAIWSTLSHFVNYLGHMHEANLSRQRDATHGFLNTVSASPTEELCRLQVVNIK